MPRSSLFPGLLGLVLAAACASGGGGHRLYEGPALDPSEEAIVVSMEARPVLAIDGEETAILCWGDTRHPEAYRPTGRTCRLRIQPGRHTVTFTPSTNSLARATTTFTAEAGKTYGLEWSQCSGSVTEGNQHQSTCVVNMVERDGSGAS